MDPVLVLVIAIIAVALIFDFINGFHDAANSVATVVATRVLTPLQAVIWAAFFNFVSAFSFGTGVAKTVGAGMVDLSAVTVYVILCGLVGAIVWDLLTWWLGLPTSSSHALFGGYAGAAMARAAFRHGLHHSPDVLVWSGWIKTLIFMVVAPLPLEFLEGRGAACLYIPLAGWAVFASVVFVDIARAVSGFLSGEPVFRHLGRQGLLAAIVAGGVFLWVQENQHLKTSFVKPAIARLGQQTWEVIEQLRALNPRVPPRSRVVFLNDPFQDWDMVFIAGLWFRDPSVIIHLHRKTPFPPEELANMDYQFRFENGKLIRVR